MNVISAVSEAFVKLGTPYALIGGRAVAARGFPRMTLDYDFISADGRVLDRPTWSGIEENHGATIDPRVGDFDDPIAGVTHIRFPDGLEADVLLAKWDWEKEVIDRAEPLEIAGLLVPVPVTSDLILLKLAAGGPIDLQDVVALILTDRERWIAEVEAKVGQVRPDVTEVWHSVRRAL